MTTLVVTRNYQVTIPRELRKQMNIAIGDKLTGVIRENTVMITKTRKQDLESAFAVIKTRKSSVDIVRSMRNQWKRHDF